jgi:hypothetical protein
MYNYFKSNVTKNSNNFLLNIWSLSTIRLYLISNSSKLNYLIQTLDSLKVKTANTHTHYFYNFSIFYQIIVLLLILLFIVSNLFLFF